MTEQTLEQSVQEFYDLAQQIFQVPMKYGNIIESQLYQFLKKQYLQTAKILSQKYPLHMSHIQLSKTELSKQVQQMYPLLYSVSQIKPNFDSTLEEYIALKEHHNKYGLEQILQENVSYAIWNLKDKLKQIDQTFDHLKKIQEIIDKSLTKDIKTHVLAYCSLFMLVLNPDIYSPIIKLQGIITIIVPNQLGNDYPDYFDAKDQEDQNNELN